MLHAPMTEAKRRCCATRPGLRHSKLEFRSAFNVLIPPVALRQTFAGLQHTIGNQAVLRMLSHRSPGIQTKLKINEPGDQHEQEADRVADQVMRKPDPSLTSDDAGRLRRKCAECEEEDKKIHTKSTGANISGTEAPSIVHQVLDTPGQPLDSAPRAYFDPRFGADFSGVRVHSGPMAAESAASVNALSYAIGDRVVLGSGASAGPNSLMAHELAHVVQQTGGGSQPGQSTASDGMIHRQDVGASGPGLITPAFPCEHGAGVELCNFTSDSTTAPNYTDCLQQGKDVIDNCRGKPGDCLPQSKCVTCDCLGHRYCQCTGIV